MAHVSYRGGRRSCYGRGSPSVRTITVGVRVMRYPQSGQCICDPVRMEGRDAMAEESYGCRGKPDRIRGRAGRATIACAILAALSLFSGAPAALGAHPPAAL